VGKKTMRLSLKTIAMRFPHNSVERVYLHGRWQQERNRDPSMVFGNHHDPKSAFDSAQQMVGGYLESIRRLPYSRHWPWSPDLVKAIRRKTPTDELAKIVWH
jgi:hypothetical protein